MGFVAQVLEPIVLELKRQVRNSDYLQTDDTSVVILPARGCRALRYLKDVLLRVATTPGPALRTRRSGIRRLTAPYHFTQPARQAWLLERLPHNLHPPVPAAR